MEGPLKKRGIKIGMMHDRYCVATWEVDQALGKYVLVRSFKSHKSYSHHPAKPSSSSAVRCISDWDGRTGFSHHENGFQMETFDGQLLLCSAPTPADKALWLAISPAGSDETPEKERADSISALMQLGRTSSCSSAAPGAEASHRLSMRYLEQGWCSQGGVGSGGLARGAFMPSDLPLSTGFARDVDLDGAESFTTESESGDAAWAEFMMRGASAAVSTEDTLEDRPEDKLEDDLEVVVAHSAADEEALLSLSDLSSVAEESSPRESLPTSASPAAPRSRAYSRGCAIANDTPSARAAKLEISDLPLEPVSVKVARLEAKLSGTDFSLSAAGEAARESDLSSSRGSLAPSPPIKQEEIVVLSSAPPTSAPSTVPAPVPAPTALAESLPPPPPPFSADRADESQSSEPSTPTALSPVALTLKKAVVPDASDAADSDVSDSTSATSTNGPLTPPPRVRAYSSAMLNSLDAFSPPPSHPRVRRYSFSSAHPAPGLAPRLLTLSSPLKPSFVEPHLGYVHSSISMMVPAFSTLLAPLSRQQSLDVQSEEDEDEDGDELRRSGATLHFFDAGRKPRAASSLSLTQESDIDEVHHHHEHEHGDHTAKRPRREPSSPTSVGDIDDPKAIPRCVHTTLAEPPAALQQPAPALSAAASATTPPAPAPGVVQARSTSTAMGANANAAKMQSVIRGLQHLSSCASGCANPLCVSTRNFVGKVAAHLAAMRQKAAHDAAKCGACQLWAGIVTSHTQTCRTATCSVPLCGARKQQK
ncbi:hypothetical protein PybrP1_002154 [[Pythium] brassicae (nom. inval.)]|nr:hypothetical protein PybrP1_002154 [[Pythium] brassicae (nom. inval.)]